MPNLEQELMGTNRSKYFAIVDLSHCYEQLPLHSKSQECQSFLTPDVVYIPRRVLHGAINTVMYLQSTLAACLLKELRSNILSWLDDILIHLVELDGHLLTIRQFLDFWVTHNFKLEPGKCSLFLLLPVGVVASSHKMEFILAVLTAFVS